VNIASVALVAAVAAILIVAALTALVIRSRRASDRRLTAGLIEIGGRMDELARELALSVEKVREDGIRARLVESLGQDLDLEEVLARCAEAAAALHGVAGAIAEIELDGGHLAATAGLGEGAHSSVGGPPDGGPVRAVGLSYHYAPAPPGRDAMRAAIAVPLESEGRRLGFLTVFGRSEDPPVAGDEFTTLEAIARHAAPAIERAAAATISAGGPSQRDPLTRLGNRQALHERLGQEVARAQRHARPLALCVLDLKELKQLNARLGHVAADDVLTEVASALREAIRPEDVAFRSGGNEFAVIMPGARRIDGEALSARVQGLLGRAAGSRASGVRVAVGLAELKADDDGVSLYERAGRTLRRDGGEAGTAA
jgi:diguanylate cyclase (GGDEF)-like protein